MLRSCLACLLFLVPTSALAQSVQSQVNSASPGTTVTIAPGSYAEVVTVTTDDLTLLGHGQVTLRGLVLDGVAGVHVEGFVFDAEGTGLPAVTVDGTGTTVTDCTVSGNHLLDSDHGEAGLRVEGDTDGLWILGNRIEDSGADGIDLHWSGSSVDLWVEQNIVRHSDLSGLWWGALHKGKTLGNSFVDNGAYGVEWSGDTPPPDPDDFLLRFNRVAGNGGTVLPGVSSLDIARYDQLLGSTDEGNQTTYGDEGTGVDSDYPPAAGGGGISVARPVKRDSPGDEVHPFSEHRWQQDRAAMPTFQGFPLLRWDPWTGRASAAVGELSGPSTSPVLEIAWDWLEEHSYLFGVGPEAQEVLGGLLHEGTDPLPAGLTRVNLRQRLSGLDVARAIQVTITSGGAVVAVQGVGYIGEEVAGAAQLSQAEAEQAALDHLGIGLDPSADADSVLAWAPQGHLLRPWYSVDVPAYFDALGDWQGGMHVLVDAITGDVAQTEESNAWAGSAIWEGNSPAPTPTPGPSPTPNPYPVPVSDWTLRGSATSIGSSTHTCPTGSPHSAVGDWLTVFDGDAVSGLYPAPLSQGPTSLPVGTLLPSVNDVPWWPIDTDTCDGSLPYFSSVDLEETDCSDGVDNDLNGRTDCDDPGCAELLTECPMWSPWLGELDCDDGNDNDNDGLTDEDDPECDSRRPAGTTEWQSRRRATNAAVRIHQFGQEYVEAFGGYDLSNLPPDQEVIVIAERPERRDGTRLPANGDSGGSMMRRGNPWVSSEPPLVGGGLPYSERYTILLSKGGEAPADLNAGRAAGVQAHEAGHWWLRALAGNLGRNFSAQGYPLGKRMTTALDEGLNYYTASAWLSRPTGGAMDVPESVNFVADHRMGILALPAAELPFLRYHLTWDKVEPCVQEQPDNCSHFAAYAGPQFVIAAGVNDSFSVTESCVGAAGPTTATRTVTIPATPANTWRSGLELKTELEWALNTSDPANGACLPYLSYRVDWVFRANAATPEGFNLICDGCDNLDLSFPFDTGNTLGFVATSSGTHSFAASDENDDPSNLELYATQRWPSEGSGNRDCRNFHASVTGGPSWGGLDGENDSTSSCRRESGVYFVGDLVSQALVDGRNLTSDLDDWEASVLAGASVTTQCVQVEETDCPEVIGDFVAFTAFILHLKGQTQESNDWWALLENRGMAGLGWGN